MDVCAKEVEKKHVLSTRNANTTDLNLLVLFMFIIGTSDPLYFYIVFQNNIQSFEDQKLVCKDAVF